MKIKLVVLVLCLAMFIEELRHFVDLGGLSNRLAFSLAKLSVYAMVVALVSLDYSTAGRIWGSIEAAMRLS